MRRWQATAWVALAILALGIGGCAQTIGVTTGGGPGLHECANLRTGDDTKVTDASGAPHPELIDFLVKGLAVDPSGAGRPARPGEENPFDLFLDCYVGPAAAHDLEQRLLRGHVVVTMLAMYGSYNIGLRRYDRIEDDAVAILRSIEAAETGLSAGSNVVVKAAGLADGLPPPVLSAYYRVDRVVDVLQVSLDVERPTFNRARDSVINIIAAIGGSPSALRALVGSALTGIKKVAVLELYGTALRNDARAFLGRVLQQPGGPRIDDWEAWDRHLHAACKPIADIARSPNRCVPSGVAIREAAAGIGPFSSRRLP